MQDATARLPDFVVAGSQKAGTTALRINLQRHPAVHIGFADERTGEVHFFNRDALWARGVDWYRSLFDQPAQLQGEKTPDYIASPVAVERMAGVLPDASLIVLLRNPIDRAYSQWNHFNQEADLRRGEGWEVVEFEEAIDRALDGHPAFEKLVAYGRYGSQLRRLLGHYPRERVFVGLAERFRREPEEQFDRVLDFLGLESIDVDYGRHHVRSYPDPLAPRIRERLRRIFDTETEAVATLLGDPLEEWDVRSPMISPPRPAPAVPQAPFGTGFEVCFVTTCMGRKHHIEQTLPRMLAQPQSCVLVVDYSCPQRVGDWVEANFDPARVRVARVPGQTVYNAARARNEGAALPASRWLAMIDGDNLLPEDFLAPCLGRLEDGHYYVSVAHPQNWTEIPREHLELYGFVMVRPEDFEAVGGYDDALQGWGGEDVDLRVRLHDHGLREGLLPTQLPTPIPHPDTDRVAHAAYRSKRLSNAVNLYYASVKRELCMLTGARKLPLAQRQELYGAIQALFRKVLETGRPANLDLAIPEKPVERGVMISRKLQYSLRVTPGALSLTDLPAPGRVQA